MSPTPRSLCLLGRDFVELGPVGVVELDGGGALALSRGALKKSYAHVDPNEDAAFLARFRHGAVLAVADGYNGTLASEIAIDSVEQRAAALVSARGADFRALLRELVEEVGRKLGRRGRSRCCLVVAAHSFDHLELASFGDSAAFRAEQETPLLSPNPYHVGGHKQRVPSGGTEWYLSCALTPGERIALVSDGVTNFTPDPLNIARVVAQPTADADCARELIENAMRGGAGDNVVAAVFAAPRPV